MKTAEEWTDIINISEACCSGEGGGLWTSEETYTLIRQIQLDAMKEGMRKAAEIVNVKCLTLDRRPWTLDVQNAHKAILTVAEQLIEKDL